MNEKLNLGAFYQTRCGLIAEVRATDHETTRAANRPVIATILHPAGSEDPGKKHAFYKHAHKENRPLTATGPEYADGDESPYDLMHEVEKPADWDELPNPAFT